MQIPYLKWGRDTVGDKCRLYKKYILKKYKSKQLKRKRNRKKNKIVIE